MTSGVLEYLIFRFHSGKYLYSYRYLYVSEDACA